MRTQEEIVERTRSRRSQDYFGFEVSEYIVFLDFPHAKEFLKDGAEESEWSASDGSPDAIKKTMLDYMPFAWEKANSCRGISANRSIMHYIAWAWMLCDEELFREIQDAYESNYEYYGKPILEMICRRMGWDHKQWDDGGRTNTET